MRRIKFKNVIAAAMIALCAAIFMFACDDMNSLHQEYLDRGEGIYIGGVVSDSIEVYSGYRKIQFRWKINADPRIDKTVIYWDQRTGRRDVPVVRTTEGDMWMETLLDDMPEAEYIFEFEMQDKVGNISKATEVVGIVWGDVYIENLRGRGIKELSRLETGETQIIWEAVSFLSILRTEIEYMDADGDPVTVTVPNDDDKTLLEGLSTGDNISVYAVHLPEKGLENINSLKRRFVIPKFERMLDKSKFFEFFRPGDNTTPQPGNNDNAWQNPLPLNLDNRDIRALWDGNIRNDRRGDRSTTNPYMRFGNPSSPWYVEGETTTLTNADGMRGILHTEDQSGQWENARFKFPHHFTFSIGTFANLSRLKLYSRGDAGSFTGHVPRYFELWATDEPKTIDDFENQAAFELYYRTTYVEHKDIDNQIQQNPNGNAAYAGRGKEVFVQPAPAPGINNWQQDWVKIGDFENRKPSGLNYNQRNDADNAVWGNGNDNLNLMNHGFEFELPDIGKRVKYIRLVVKYPNWQHTNCINIGEVTFWGDDL